MGKAVAEAAVSAGLELVPVSFSDVDQPGNTLEIADTEIRIHGLSEREELLSSVMEKYPDVIVVDYTAPDAVNGMDIYQMYILIEFCCKMVCTVNQFVR
jgi:4-hydroxy-tetrahydrodipicolinate reductase